jgi:hypothetical protein
MTGLGDFRGTFGDRDFRGHPHDKPGDRQDVPPQFADNLATRITRGRVTSFSKAMWSLPMRRSSDGARAGSIAVMASSLPIVALFIDVLLYLNRLG